MNKISFPEEKGYLILKIISILFIISASIAVLMITLNQIFYFDFEISDFRIWLGFSIIVWLFGVMSGVVLFWITMDHDILKALSRVKNPVKLSSAMIYIVMMIEAKEWTKFFAEDWKAFLRDRFNNIQEEEKKLDKKKDKG